MSRTIPRAYVTAAWPKNRVDAEDLARKFRYNAASDDGDFGTTAIFDDLYRRCLFA